MLEPDGVDPRRWPFSLPAVAALDRLELDRRVTFLVGENGSGKSTLVEAIAVACGLNPEGGGRNFTVATTDEEYELAAHLRVIRGARRPGTDYFLRAESLFNVATSLDEMRHAPGGAGTYRSYGGRSLHEQSHGESFLALLRHRFGADGFYVLDEPEAALSVRGQLAALRRIVELTWGGAQFLIATHSPILLSLPGARIIEVGERGLDEVAYTETDPYQLTRAFLEAPDRFLDHLLADD